MKSYGKSDVGKTRSENQDAFFNHDKAIGQFENLYILADGMGGHNGGSIASKIAVDTVVDTIQSMEGQPLEIIEESIEAANKRIFTMSAENNALFGMGTTLIVCTIKENKLYFGHIGDSRLYAYDGQNIKQLTTDHSYVQELLEAGVITAKEARNHPNKNRITRAVGVDKKLDIDLHVIDIDKKSMDTKTILLCSDGLTNMMSDVEIMNEIERNNTPKEICHALMSKSLEAGGTDNITVIIIERN